MPIHIRSILVRTVITAKINLSHFELNIPHLDELRRYCSVTRLEGIVQQQRLAASFHFREASLNLKFHVPLALEVEILSMWSLEGKEGGFFSFASLFYHTQQTLASKCFLFQIQKIHELFYEYIDNQPVYDCQRYFQICTL